jgi:hypothetical protein
MIKLAELVNRIHTDNESGLTPIDNWKMTDADFMEDMGFKASGMYYFSLSNPKLTVSHQKGVGFHLKDETQKVEKVFPKFDELVEYFTKYQQKWDNQPYL